MAKKEKRIEREKTKMSADSVDSAAFQLEHFAEKYRAIAKKMRGLKIDFVLAGNDKMFRRSLVHLSSAAAAVEKALDATVISKSEEIGHNIADRLLAKNADPEPKKK